MNNWWLGFSLLCVFHIIANGNYSHQIYFFSSSNLYCRCYGFRWNWILSSIFKKWSHKRMVVYCWLCWYIISTYRHDFVMSFIVLKTFVQRRFLEYLVKNGMQNSQSCSSMFNGNNKDINDKNKVIWLHSENFIGDMKPVRENIPVLLTLDLDKFLLNGN